MLSMFTAIGSAHAGKPLTTEQLGERLRDPVFRAKFNGPPPTEVTFEDEQTAALAVEFERAKVIP